MSKRRSKASIGAPDCRLARRFPKRRRVRRARLSILRYRQRSLNTPAWGAGLSTEPALKVTSSNGDRTLVLECSSANLKGNLLELTLRDRVQPIAVHLFYRVFEDQGMIAGWSKVENLATSQSWWNRSLRLRVPRGE